GGNALLATIAQAGSNLVCPSLQGGSVNENGVASVVEFNSGATPVVCDLTLRVEIRSAGSRGHRLTGKDLAGMYRAGCAGRSYSAIAAPHEYKSCLEPYASKIRAWSRGRRTAAV